jgi:hypothetical protein
VSFLHEAAESIAAVGKPAYLYYLGDFDPSGCDIPRAVEEGIRDYAAGAEIHFERVAVTEEQIHELNLATRPTKQTDSRSRTFRGESVEVDAIPSATLRALVRERIERHIDRRALQAARRVENEERETLERILKELPAFG